MQYPWIIYVIIVWTLPWKGIALWRAAKNNSKIWFVILFLINTLAVLDIIYIVFFSKGKKEEMKNELASPVAPGNGNKIV
jgi:hypothetical protein